MRKFSHIAILSLVGLLTIGIGKAHEVDWMENPYAFAPNNAMVFYYPRELSGKFYVDPSYDEPCTVVVNLNASTSTLVNAQVLPPSTANSVTVLVQILRAPSNHTENATITGEWHATGLPAGSNCNDANPVRRKFRGFRQAADENGVSRIYVGFHFRDAVEKGLKHGAQIGDWAVDHALQLQRPSSR